MKKLIPIILVTGVLRAASPVLFYSDLDSGPKSNCEAAGEGAIVTVNGRNFGATRGTSKVYFGATEVVRYHTWSDTQAAVAISPSTSDGAVSITVETAAGTSNGVTFTVRSGTCRFVATTGTNSGAGTFSSPWQTIAYAKNTMVAGDIVYVMNGVTQTRDGSSAYAIYLNGSSQGGSGTSGNPKAIGAYPGASVIVGCYDTASCSINHSLISNAGSAASPNHYDYWTWFGIDWRGNWKIGNGTHWRMVNNSHECPDGDGQDGCIETSASGYIFLAGNTVRNVGCGETAAEAGRTNVKCVATTVAGTVGSSGTMLTSSGNNFTSNTYATHGSYAGDIVIVTNCGGCGAEGQERILATINTAANPDTATISSAFVPDLPAGSTLSKRHTSPTKLYHAVYFSTDTSHVEFGWNNVHDVQNACRGVQFHSSPTGSQQASAPTTGQTAGGSLGARTYYVKAAYLGVKGTTTALSSASTATIQAIDANNLLRVISPTNINVTLNTGDTISNVLQSYNVYASSSSSGPFYLQNASPITIGTDWTEPGTGLLTSGTTAPTSSLWYKTGYNQWEISIHDNVIRKTGCSSVNLATIDPSKGAIKVYNNVLDQAGFGGSKFESASTAAAFEVDTIGTNMGYTGSGTVEIYNNTIWDAASETDTSATRGAFYAVNTTPAITISLKNNFIGPSSSRNYFSTGSTLSKFIGDYNSWNGGTGSHAYGSGSDGSHDLTSAPLFTDTSTHDFTLQSSSPLRDAGTTVSYATADFIGTARPQASAFDIGAYEFSTAAAPAVPANVSAVANSTSQITISWDAVAGPPDSIKIERALGCGGTFSEVYSVSGASTSKADTPLLQNTNYCYKLRSFTSAGGYSAYSSTANATTQEDTPAPTLTTTVIGTLDTKLLVRYTTSNTATCSSLKVSTSPAFTSPVENLADSGGSTVRDVVFGESTPLTAGTTYYIRILCNSSTESGETSGATDAAITPISRTIPIRVGPSITSVQYGTTSVLGSSASPSSGVVNVNVNTGQMLYYRSAGASRIEKYAVK